MKTPSNAIRSPLENIVSTAWLSIPAAYRMALVVTLLVNLAAYGFHMTNLSFHHDDVGQFFRLDGRMGHQLGRYGYSWLHHYVQGDYYLPFLQLLEAIILTTTYGLVVAHAFGLRRTADVAIAASIVSVFPYMAQLYHYDTAAFPFSVAHLLAGLGALLSLNHRRIGVVVAALLYAAAFAIYQSVLGNALAIVAFAAIFRLIAANDKDSAQGDNVALVLLRALIAIVSGGLLYVLIVKFSGVPVDSYQGADKAFSIGSGIDLPLSLSVVLKATKGALVWPENYFPLWAKQLQQVLIAMAGLYCLVSAVDVRRKCAVLILLALGLMAPRALQFLHPHGAFHNLTLTAYAVVIAGVFGIVARCSGTVVRNLALLAACLIVYAYVVQANWMATVNYLNWNAHQLTMSRILARVDALGPGGWDGRTVAVHGKLNLVDSYPYKKETGVAVSFIDEEHFQKFARLLRQDVQVVRSKEMSAELLRSVAELPTWPAAGSVQLVGNTAVVVLSRTPQD